MFKILSGWPLTSKSALFFKTFWEYSDFNQLFSCKYATHCTQKYSSLTLGGGLWGGRNKKANHHKLKVKNGFNHSNGRTIEKRT